MKRTRRKLTKNTIKKSARMTTNHSISLSMKRVTKEEAKETNKEESKETTTSINMPQRKANQMKETQETKLYLQHAIMGCLDPYPRHHQVGPVQGLQYLLV